MVVSGDKRRGRSGGGGKRNQAGDEKGQEMSKNTGDSEHERDR